MKARVQKDHQQTKDDLVALNAINRDLLDDTTKVSYDLKKQDLEESIADFKWRYPQLPGKPKCLVLTR